MAKSLRVLLTVLVLVCAASFLLPSPTGAQVSLTTLGSPSTQSFDSLTTAGTANPWTDNTTLPGWYAQFSATPANPTTYRADSGGSNTGAIYSWGVAGVNPLTERAFGMLSSGTPVTVLTAIRLVNNTGATITSLDISYNGEQWRDGGAATPNAQTTFFEYQVANAGTITDANTPTTGWTGFSSLDFTSPTFTNTGAGAALDGNAAANRTAKSATLSVTVNPGQEVWLRWRDINDGGNDHGLGVDDFSVTPQGGVPTPTLNISDVTLAEGNPPGTTTFTFAVTLTAPAGAGGVTFDIATADGTAQDDNPVTEDNDYVAQSLTGQTIPSGSTGPYNFSVTVNRDTTAEPNETFFVNVTNITGANAGDTQGQGTINNDDVALTPIHDIQGPGASSPIVGASVTTTGIVTGVRSNGFFIQEPDATVDADPATSEGILVFGSPVPAAAVVGALVQVTGTVTEFVPPQDTLQPPLTELTGASVVQLSTGNPLPAAIPLTATFPDPAGPHDQLERLEGMRVSVASLTVSGPTLGNVNETNATATSSGVFYGVVTGVPRPFREAGIPAPDPAPSGGGTIPPIPRFDSNPERIRVDSDNLVGGPLLDAGAGAVVTGLVGPLDYTFRTYSINPDPGASIGVAGGPAATAVTPPSGQEFTVGAYNVERLFDTVNDPGIGEPVPTPAAFDMRLNKASLGIRNSLQMPDILGVVEVENLTTLQALAARISADALAASQPDPEYDAYLVEGNDVGGIDVGFLVKTASVDGGTTPRVEVVEVLQELDGTLFINPDSSTETLNDRPPLRLNAIVHHPNGASFPVTVIVNHMRSLNGVNSETAGTNGWPTEGARVRAKRQEQAEDLANLVQARQVADPAEHIILVGDFNAFEVNDGLGHSMGVIGGTPVPDNETAVAGDGIDLVNPDLDNLFDTPPPAERYSFIFDGNAQNLDHILINAPLDADTLTHRIEHPRINADFPETARNNGTTPVRLSDHDPVVAFFEVAGFATADLSITKTDGVTTAVPGGSVTYTITAANAGPDPVTGGTVADTFPAVLTCTWTCVGAGGGTCTAAGSGNISDTVNLPVGASVTYTASCTISASATGTLGNTATVSGGAVSDPDPGNNSATDTDTLTPQADLAITKTDGVTTVDPGGPVTYTITASNAGPSDAPGSTVTDNFPALCTWTCVGAGGGTCTASGSVNINDTVNLPAGGSVTYTASCTVSPVATGTLSNTATVAAPAGVTDPDPANNSATDTDTINELGGDYLTATPCRAVDTRSGAPLQDGVPQTFNLRGVCGISASATSVALIVTVVAATGDGELSIYPGDAPPPAVPTMPFPASVPRASNAIVPLSSLSQLHGVITGDVAVSASVAGGGTIHVVLDVMGYFE